jgi:hypothetical protein
MRADAQPPYSLQLVQVRLHLRPQRSAETGSGSGRAPHPTGLILIHLKAFHLSALLSFSSALMLLRQPFIIPYTLLVLQEIEELCEEWEPEPLAPPLPEALRNWREPVLSSPAGRLVTANGRSALNFASLNFLGIAGSADAKEAARETIHKYGVGSCGPRGFYGTIDVHLQLEVRAAGMGWWPWVAALFGVPDVGDVAAAALGGRAYE